MLTTQKSLRIGTTNGTTTSNKRTWYTELEVMTIQVYLSTETTSRRDSRTMKKNKPNKKQADQRQYNDITIHHHKKWQNTTLHIYLRENCVISERKN
eukprot:4381069-Amphidinium_carterae.1